MIARLMLVLMAVTASAALAAPVDFDLQTAKLALTERGAAAITFSDGAAWPTANLPAFVLETDAGESSPRRVSLDGATLKVEFTNGAAADFVIAREKSFVLLRLMRLKCDRPVRRFQIFALPAPAGAVQIPSLGAAQKDDHFAAVMVGEPNVQCLIAPASVPGGDRVTLLRAQTIEPHGIQPAAVGAIACPASEAMDAIRRFEKAANLPSPNLDGQWNKTSDAIRRSYLFLTRFKQSQFDEALKIARRGGFAAILIGQESWCKSTGHYAINVDNFPDGLDGLARTVRRFHDAGFKVGLHFLAASIYPPDQYLAPVPDPRLVKDATTTLAEAIDAKADFVPTPAALENFPAEDGGYEGKGTVIQIDGELIHYGGLSSPPKLGFARCQRGYLGTKAAVHAKGAKIAHLARSYGYHMFDMDTSLLDEVTTNFARVANAADIDMIYFDGSERLQGDHWYYNAKLHKAYYDKLKKKDMLLQASSFSPYSWHMLARSASADGHGDIKGYLDERSPWFDSIARGGMPLDVGWYYGYDPSATPDMFEYVLGATIGYGASMSYQTSVEAAANHPFSGEILDLIARYEKLRLSGRVSEEMRQRLRIAPALRGKMPVEQRASRLDQRREYRLITQDNKQCFQRVIYGDWHEFTSRGEENWQISFPSRGEVGVDIHARGAVTDPYVEISGQRFIWKGKLGDGEYAVLRPGEPARRYAPHMPEPAAGKIVKPFSINAGQHRVSFGSTGGGATKVRVRLVLQTDERYPIE